MRKIINWQLSDRLVSTGFDKEKAFDKKLYDDQLTALGQDLGGLVLDGCNVCDVVRMKKYDDITVWIETNISRLITLHHLNWAVDKRKMTNDPMTTQPLTTTLNRIRTHSLGDRLWPNLLKALGKTEPDNEPVTYAFIARSNGIGDALWCCRAEPQYAKTWRLMAVAFARQVQHLMKDQRSIDALYVAERHANGLATDEELAAARANALVAAREAASAAARKAASAAASAAFGGKADAREAAWAGAWAGTWAAASAAREAAWEVGGYASMDTAMERQLEIFIKMVGE